MANKGPATNGYIFRAFALVTRATELHELDLNFISRSEQPLTLTRSTQFSGNW